MIARAASNVLSERAFEVFLADGFAGYSVGHALCKIGGMKEGRICLRQRVA